MRIAIFASLVVALCIPAFAADWQQGFEGSIAGAKPYHREAPQAALAAGTDRPAEGKQYIRATLPGERKLEGLNVDATGLTGGRLATASAKVRGSGEIWLCLISSNGWLYSPEVTPLTDEWQTVSLSKVLMNRDKTLGIHFISQSIQKGAIFEVDDIQVTLSESPVVDDAAVGPWRLEAEDFATRSLYLADDATARGGQLVEQATYLLFEGMPFPRTSRPVTVYMRTRPAASDDTYNIYTRWGGNRQTVASASPGKQPGWQWVKFPAVSAGEVGERFGIDFRAANAVVDKAAMDSLVISTEGDLSDEQLDSAPPLFREGPLVAVTRTSEPPALDGQPDDACWSRAVACTNFLQMQAAVRAAADTSVKLCYDDQNLYMLYACAEPILNVAQQRRHEFRATVTERDADVYGDDSCVALLDPIGDGKTLYDLTFNSLGTVTDATGSAPDYWQSRDTSWNSGTRAAGSAGEDLWIVEVSVPFADLGVSAPAPGTTWKAVLGRIAKARKESSSWNQSGAGFHDPLRLGTLLFVDAAPAVALDAPSSLRLGSNPLELSVGVAPTTRTGLLLATQLGSPEGAESQYASPQIATAPAKVSADFTITREGKFDLRHAVLDAASLQPIYQTPRVEQAVKSAFAEVTLSCDGPYELFLNAESIARGTGATEPAVITAPVQKGSNIFALKLAKGTGRIRIKAKGLTDEIGPWKLAPGDGADAITAADDRSWPDAPVIDQTAEPASAPLIGKPGEAILLRKTLLWEKTRAWPTPSPALFLARGAGQHLTFICDGLPGRQLLDWTTYLAVPSQFEVLGSTGYYGHVDYAARFECTSLGEQQINGQTMRVVKIAATKPIVQGRHKIFSLFNVFVRCAEDTPDPGDDGLSFVYWSEANGGTIVEPRQEIPVRLLPPLNGKQPKQLVWQLWGSYFGTMNSEDLRIATIETAQAAGINDLVSGELWTCENAMRYGMTSTRGMNFQAWSLNMAPYLEEHPQERLIKADGKPDDALVCTSLLLGNSWSAVEDKLREQIEATKAHTYDYDYEYSPFTGPHSCYCARCLDAFRERAGIAEDVKLTPETIKQEHKDEWVDFMAWQVANIFRRFKDSVHALAPGTRFSTYSGYQTPENPERYGVNWEYIGQLEACDRAGCGYGRPVPAITDTVKALRGIPLLFGELIHPYDTAELSPLLPFRKAVLLRRALDCSGGVLIYDRMPMDGRSWFAVAETTRLVADFEDLFLTGERATLGDLNEASVTTLTDGKTTLVCVMNGSSKPGKFTVPLPAGKGAGREYYSGSQVAAGQTVECSLPPGEAEVFVLADGE